MADKIKQKDIIESSVVETFDELNKRIETSIKLISDLTKSAADLSKNFNPENIQQVTQNQKEYNEVSEKSQQEQKKAASNLEKLQQKIKDVNEEEERAKIALQQKRKAIKEKIKAEKESTSSIQNLTKLLKQQVKTEKQATEQNKRLLKARKEMDVSTAKGAKSVQLINKRIDANNNLLKSNASTMGKQKMNIGNYSSALSGLGGSFGGAMGQAQQFGGALKALAAIPIVLVIIAIVGALKGLVKLFKSTDSGATKLEATMNGLKAAMGVFKGALLDVIEGVKARFERFVNRFKLLKAQLTGNQEEAEKFRKKIADLSDEIDSNKPFENLGKRAKAAYDEVHALTFQMDELNDVIIGSISSQKNLQLIMEKNAALSKDQTLSDQERIKFLDKAMQAAKDYYGNEQKWAQESYNQKVKQYAAEVELSAEALDQLIRMNGEEAAAARENNELVADAWNELNDEKIEELENMFVAAIEKETEYNKQVKRFVSQRSSMVKRGIEEQKRAEQELANLRKSLNEEEVEDFIANDEEFKENLEESLEEENEIILEKLEELNESRLEKYNADVEASKAADEAKKQSYRDYVSFGVQQAQQLTGSIIGYMNQELANQQAIDIERARSRGATEAEITQIEKKYAKERKQMKITEAIINTALGVINMLATVSYPLNIVMAALVGVMGAIEIATISSAKFAKGTKDSGGKGQIAWVGEEGTEKINYPDGRSSYTPNKATLTYLPPHSEVIPNPQLQNELAYIQSGRKKNTREDGSFKQLIDAINKKEKKDETYINVTENGFSVTAKRGVDRYKYYDRRYRS